MLFFVVKVNEVLKRLNVDGWYELPGCVSMGDDLPHAERMAVEALGLHIHVMEQDGDTLPPVTLPPFEDMPDGGIVMPITIFPDIVKADAAVANTVLQ